MKAQNYSVRSVTLAELKTLGRFVRLQDLDASLAVAKKGDQIPPAYPLFATRLPVNEYIDVFEEPEWRRVKFLGHADNRVHFRHERGLGSIIYNPYCVAPAGYFTDHVDKVPRAETAELLDIYKAPIPNHIIGHAELERVSGPYLIFKIRTYNPNARWVEENDMRTFSVSVHMLDSRVRIEGVRSRPPLYNFVLAVSHRWKSRSEPDEHGAQFQELMQIGESHSLHDCQSFAIDFCALPQRPRTPDDEEVFARDQPEFQKLFSRHAIILGEGSEDYGTRGWCMLELMQASAQNSIVNPEVLQGGLAEAYKLAKGYADSARLNMQAITATFEKGGQDPARDWISDRINVGIYNQAVSQRNQILEIFENQLEVSFPADRPIILEQVREQFHLWKHRSLNWTGLGTGQPLPK